MKKSKVKPTSIRFDQETLSEIDQRCDDLSCSRNDYIKNAVDNMLEMEATEDEEPKEEPIPTAKVTKVSYDDGKTWIDVD